MIELLKNPRQSDVDTASDEALKVRCPVCAASIGAPCIGANMRYPSDVHLYRVIKSTARPNSYND